MVPILRHIVITDFHRPCRCLIFHSFFLYFQNKTCTETHLQVEVYEIIFSTSHHTHETGSEQESCAYLLRRCNLSKADFRLRSAQYFCYTSLYGSSKLMILDALERRFEGSSEY
jgi:hypothetical protein